MMGAGLRYLVIPPVIFLIILYFGNRYIRTAFHLTNLRQAIQYYLACLFGINYPVLIIGDGRASVPEGQENLLLKIGGPGFLFVLAGNVVLVENLSGKLRVLGPGKYAIARNETIKEYTSLDERYRPIEKLTTRSKDGIEVVVRDIHYRYRVANQLNSGETGAGGPETLFQYSDEAVIQMVYNRTQSGSGIGNWEDSVNGIVESIISDFIRQHLVDYLIAPKTRGVDPRAEIYAEFYSLAGQKKFRERGAELVWIDIGHFETPEKTVAEQRVSTWQAKWQGNANIVRELKDAQDMGQAEAQAALLLNVADTLDAVGPPGETRQNMRPLYLARIAQLLDSMGDLSFATDSDAKE
jgi:hypothetical protein